MNKRNYRRFTTDEERMILTEVVRFLMPFEDGLYAGAGV